jgi:hypothetical protein
VEPISFAVSEPEVRDVDLHGPILV